jgi:[heparan sulfate]-glucosamine 3-sulfotransferase 3
VIQKSLQNTTTESPNYAHQHQDSTEIRILGSIVRIINLRDPENETDHSSQKYRLFKQQGLQRHLPDALIIGVKKSGTRALLEFIRLHPDGKEF